MNGARVRTDFQNGSGVAARRAIAVLSLAGIASFVPILLRQVGIIRHLPDPPLSGFNSDRINLSDTAFRLGLPDGALGLASIAANLPLAAVGDSRRAEEQPWFPIAALAKAAVDALVAGWFFYQMPAKEKAWCGYCVAGQAISFAVLAMAVPEGRRALRSVRS